MTGFRQIPSRLMPWVALSFLLVVCAGQVRAQTPRVAVPDTAENLTGTILFIQGRPQAALPVPVADIRATGVSRLEAALRGKGHRTADRQIIEDLTARWRIRGSHLVPREFLTELNQEHDVGQVLVVTLLSDNGRFLMTARLIDTATGLLTYVELKDVSLPPQPQADLPPELTDWRRVLDRICWEIAPFWTAAPDPAPVPVLILPTRGIASDPNITSAAAHSLLKVLVAQGLPLIDPALAEVEMIRAGLPSNWLDPQGRRILQNKFPSEVILVSELVSYDNRNSFASQDIYARGESAPQKLSLTVFSMTMRAVDLRTGTAIRSAQIIHEKLPPTGWFGNRIQTTLLQELETTSLELWAAYSPAAEDD